MEKKFKMMQDHLEVVATQSDKIFLPSEMGSNEIGTYDQTTIQKIDKDKIELLVAFVETEHTKATTQLKELDKQLENIGEVYTIDEAVVEACKKQIGKGTKVFKQKMLVLNQHLDNITRRKNLTAQKEYIVKQLKQMTTELDDMSAALK